MKPLHHWLGEYDKSHRHPANKRLHWVCVPAIAWSVLGLLRALPLGGELLNACSLAAALAVVYYARLSWRLAIGMAIALVAACALANLSWRELGAGHVALMIAIFVVAWVGQFIGHRIEGRKPSFFTDLLFLLIGPLWLMADVYRRLRLPLIAR